MRKKNIKASPVNLTLNMRYKNDKNYQICHHQIRFFQAQNAPKSVFGTGGAYDAPPDPLVGWGEGYPLPIPHPPRRLRRLNVSVPDFVSRKLATLNTRATAIQHTGDTVDSLFLT